MNDHPHRQAIDANRRNWDRRVEVHRRSYPLDEFLAGASTLRPLEIAALGDVRGKRLLHLQCHFGLDTLSWARLGADVTGVDFSPAALDLARDLAARTSLRATFVEGALHDLQDSFAAEFDAVVNTWGVLCWLPELDSWARLIANALKPGGRFFLADDHPISQPLALAGDGRLVLEPGYFDGHWYEPATTKTYGTDQPVTPAEQHDWNHPLARILNALIVAGLHVERVDEYPFSFWQRYPEMTRADDGWYYLPDGHADAPLILTVTASKPAGASRPDA